MIEHYFTTDKGTFSYIWFKDFNIRRLPTDLKVFKNGYINIPAAIDIETTSFYSKKYDKDIATMWIWQFGLGDMVILGRTWEEFKTWIDLLNLWLKDCYKGANLLILDHNFSFEFQWIKGWLKWNRDKNGVPEIFAKSDRSILYAKCGCVEFRDTLSLTDLPLAKLQKNYGLDVGKLKGDLDYNVLRTNKTETISYDELAYCINDVKVLCDLFKKYIVPEFFEVDKLLPLTSTGLVRQDMMEEFKSMSKEEQKKMRSKIRNAQPSEQIYHIFREWVFRGGYVHANTIACNYLGKEKFWSKDLKSAHPSQMLLRLFPYKFHKRNNNCFKQILDDARNKTYAFFGIFVFKNIRSRTYHSYESKSKIIAETGGKYENGRLIEARTLKVCITDIDFFNYEMLYDWDSVEPTLLYQAKYEPLPDYVRKTVMKYFTLKETLPKDSIEYMRAKRKLNSCFGCCATSLPEQELVFDEDMNEMRLSGISRSYDELVRWLILLPQWAIWIAAYTRNDIVRSITEDGTTQNYGLDCIYYDTDSNKVRNPEAHEWWFEKFNKERYEEVLKMECYNFDRKLFYKIGSFDFEYEGDRFKVLEAKRYLVKHGNEIQVTVAGMVKGSLEEYCEKQRKQDIKDKINNVFGVSSEGKDIEQLKEELTREINNSIEETKDLIWDEFTDSLYLSEEDSKKKTTVYTDEYIEDYLTDFEGKKVLIKERSCVAIVPIPFTMSIEAEFLSRIETLKHERERMVYKGVW